jgi:hypothetical protein
MKKVISTLILGMIAGLTFSQSLKVHKNDGSITTIQLSTIDSITFTENDIPVQGLVAYYPFNGNANDESGNGLNGTPLNGATLTLNRFGEVSKAYSFDGIDDYILVNNSQNLDLGKNYSLSAWIWSNEPSNPTSGLLYTIIAKRDEVMSGNKGLFPWNFSIDYSLSGVFKKFMNARTGSYAISNSIVNGGSWQHLAVTVNNDFVTLWMNGISSGTYTFMTNNLITTQPVLIGWNRAGGTNREQFNGKLDDIRIYNRALTDSEIQQLYHEGSW